MSKLDSVKEWHYAVIPFVNCEAHKAPCDTFAKLPDRPLNSQFAIPRSTARCNDVENVGSAFTARSRCHFPLGGISSHRELDCHFPKVISSPRKFPNRAVELVAYKASEFRKVPEHGSPSPCRSQTSSK